jgi:glucose-1-phosphate thymidylyltransferase
MINLVIPAAGAATRLRPLSAYTSKAMVRVNGKPCIDYILEQAHKLAKINEVIIVDGKFDDIREYCKIKHPSVNFVKQESLTGPKDAITIGLKSLRNPSLPVVVWLGDSIVLDNNLLLGSDFLLCKEVSDHHNWCMWDSNDSKFYDKPDCLIEGAAALVGVYSFSNGDWALKAFKQNRESYDISTALINYGYSNNCEFDKVLTNKWYDIGDLPTYYKTCAELLNLKARSFHSIKYDPDLGTIHKQPDFHDIKSIERIQKEKAWYSKLNPEQQMFTPRILPHKTNLIMSYESGTLLSDMMLYENLPASTWEYIIDKVFKVKLKYFNEMAKDDLFINDFHHASKDIWLEKTKERIEDAKFSNATHADCWTFNEKQYLINTLGAQCHAITNPIHCMHGDLHFGNILYDQQTDQIKLIDPRGEYSPFWSGTYGDDLYDWAKLAHDLYHGYNALVANVPQNELVKTVFTKLLQKYNLPMEQIINGGLLLIATCIPLHSDNADRQIRFRDYVRRCI